MERLLVCRTEFLFIAQKGRKVGVVWNGRIVVE
jgi:hypothetical protein